MNNSICNTCEFIGNCSVSEEDKFTDDITNCVIDCVHYEKTDKKYLITVRDTEDGYVVTQFYSDKIPKAEKSSRFVKPTYDELTTYIRLKNLNVDASAFLDFYESVGWKIGTKPMKDWKPDWNCWQIGYFDLHKYFHLLYHWWNDPHAYTGDRYTSEILFTNEQKVYLPFEFSQSIKCFELYKAMEKSNLKHSCLDTYMNDDRVVDLFRYLNFYCSYPEITEKLMKQGYKDDVNQYLYGNLSGCFNVRAKNVPAFFKLDKAHLKTLHEFKHIYGRDEIRAMQYMQNNGIKLTYSVFNFISSNYRNIGSIRKLQNFMGMQKLIKYVEKQGTFCACRNYYGTLENLFFANYKDYIQQCEMLEYDLTDKNIAVPMNLFQAHQQLTEILNAKKAAEEAEAQRKKMKGFKKRLQKLKDKYCYSNGELFIRPAESYKDLQKEGTTLHHCVYSNYADRHIKGTTTILFIRRVSEPDKPFYTMEFKDNDVVQCRTAYNGGMTDEIKAFIVEWKKYLKSNNKRKKKEAA